MDVNTLTGDAFDSAAFDSVLKRRFFFTEAFEIYRTASKFTGKSDGLYDYGPPGCALQANIVEIWRKHFVLEENMLEVDCTILTPGDVFKTSGHVDKFADWMCKDPKNGILLRADHLVESVLEKRLLGDKIARAMEMHEAKDDVANDTKEECIVDVVKEEKLDNTLILEYEEILAKIDDYNGEELGKLIQKFDIRNPRGGNKVLPPVLFNLMFETAIGPSSRAVGYLRPETAQGQFVNFRKLLDFNQNTMPFASASIGKSFRNEISTRQGLLRVREFLMAEIEHYVDPEGGKKHSRFSEVKDEEVALLDRSTQLSGKTTLQIMSIDDAVKSGMVDNETLGYFLVRIQLFLQKLGVDMKKLRFRQHMANEMAHYAKDCWDAELLTHYGWIECVGCADRSAYDLTVHSNRTGRSLDVREPRDQPLKVTEWKVDVDKKNLGPKFRKDAKAVETAIELLTQDQLVGLSLTLEREGCVKIDVPGITGGNVELEKTLISITKQERVEYAREYTPNVIEPSFGIGRILYSLLQHVYWHRPGDEARAVLSLLPAVAPTKVLIVPLSKNPEFDLYVKKVSTRLRALEISNSVDDSTASIGKRYSRNDELGTPFGITVDFDTLRDQTVTLRERDSTKQVRASEDDILQAIVNLIKGQESWRDVLARLPELAG